MHPREILQDRFKRVESFEKMRFSEDKHSAASRDRDINTRDLLIKSPNLSNTQRRSSINLSTTNSTKARRNRVARSTLPPSLMYCLMEKEEAKQKLKKEMLNEWKKEDKIKYEFMSRTHRQDTSKIVKKKIIRIRRSVFAIIWLHRLTKPHIKKFKTSV